MYFHIHQLHNKLECVETVPASTEWQMSLRTGFQSAPDLCKHITSLFRILSQIHKKDEQFYS